jgi:glutamate-1-semialdehyde aminotransferase
MSIMKKEVNAASRSLKNSNSLFERSKKVIPGACQTFSKGYTQYVQGVAPIFLERGKGCKVWDVDGNEYIDYVQGLLPNILGYANSRVNDAAFAELQKGHSFSMPTEIEVRLAEKLCSLIPCAEMVRFGKNGSDVTAAAVRAARAYTKRDVIAVCGYHGWQDWYIGSTPRNLGVPKRVRELTVTFTYNDIASLEKCFEEHKDDIAAVVMEPMNFAFPEDGFLEQVKHITHKNGSLLVFDEICSGWHFGIGGAQKFFGVIPDMAAFGKAMANGYPISAVVGRRDVMQTFENIFFSGTFGGETASMGAALETIKILEEENVIEKLWNRGERLRDAFEQITKEANIEHHLRIMGIPAWTLIQFKDFDGKDSFEIRSYFQQECIKRGLLLLATHNMCYAHTEDIIDYTIQVYREIIPLLADAIYNNDIPKRMEGQIIQPIFKVR